MRTHASSATLTARPTTGAQRQCRVLFGLEGEDNEVADFVDDGAQIVTAYALGNLAELQCALARPSALIEECSHIDDLVPGSVPTRCSHGVSDNGLGCGAHRAVTPAATIR